MKFKLQLVVILLLSIFFVSGSALAMTEQERQTLIGQLQSQINQLTQQLNRMLAQQQGTETQCHTFNTDLDTGSTGSDVLALQTILQEEGLFINSEIESQAESQNQIFGTATGQAVKKFKTKYKSQILSAGTTKVGVKVRGMLNRLYGCEVPTQSTCTPDWSCANWNSCSNGKQTRNCVDLNRCGIETDKPNQEQGCTVACVSSCTNKTCGASDGCGGRCQTGSCSTGASCVNGQCVTTAPVASRCISIWSCTLWNTCSSNKQIRTCTDTKKCTVATIKPMETRYCASTITPTPTPTPSATGSLTVDIKANYSNSTVQITDGKVMLSWKSTNAGSCTASGGWSGRKGVSGSETIERINSYTTFTLTCSNLSGSISDSVSVNVSAVNNTNTTCTPSWQLGTWSICSNGQQTRTVTDSRNCGITTSKPPVTQTCSSASSSSSSGGSSAVTCQNVSIPGLTFSCIYNRAPYGVSGDFIISNEQFLTWKNTFGSQYTSQYSTLRECGCSWAGDGMGIVFNKMTCATGPLCDSSKVPNQITPGMLTDYCSRPSTPDVVQWSSRISKGELTQSALQNTINDDKINGIIIAEKNCVQNKIYYIGGDTHSPTWMCRGVKYRKDPNSASSQWQKWSNGAWTSLLVWGTTNTGALGWIEDNTCQ